MSSKHCREKVRTNSIDRKENSRFHKFVLCVLSLSMIGAMTTWFSMTAVLSELKTLWELDLSTSSLLTIAVQAGFVIGSLIMVVLKLPDKVSPQHLFFWASASAGLVTILTGLVAQGLLSAIFLRLLTGMLLAGVYAPGLKLMSSWFKVRRGMALGLIIGALTLGSASPHIFEVFSFPSWKFVLILSGILSIMGGIAVRLLIPVGPYVQKSGKYKPGGISALFKNRAARLVNYAYFGHMWELYAMWSWFGVFALHSIETNSGFNQPVLASILTFTVVASGAIGAWFGGVLGDKIGSEWISIGSLALSGSMALLIGFSISGPLWLLWLLGIIWGISIIADSGQFSVLLIEHVDEQYVGSALTVQLAIGFVVTILSIGLITVFERLVGWQFAFWLLVPGPIVGVISIHKLQILKRNLHH